MLLHLLERYRRLKVGKYFYRFYAHTKLISLVESYRRDMLCNVRDFVYETPSERRQRKKAMEYYARTLRIKQAKEKAKLTGKELVEISEPETIEFAKIEAAITKL